MNKIFPLKNQDSIYGTSYHDDFVYASLDELERVLGVKAFRYYDDKVNYEFDLETEDGIPFTIYDWKEGEYLPTDMKIHYHIGARTPEESKRVSEILKECGLESGRTDYSAFFANLLGW